MPKDPDEERKVIVKVLLHCKDLTVHELNSLNEKAESIYDIVNDVMKHGGYCYNGDVANFIPPHGIERIEFHKGLPPEEEDDDA